MHRKTIETFLDILNLWPTRQAFADAVGCTLWQAKSWAARNNIPGEWFDPVVKACWAKGRPEVSHELMCRLSAQKLAQDSRLADIASS